jgi:hypothetical protein
VPLEWQRSTMAHLSSVYPFHADTGFGDRGVFIGANVTGGMSGFFFDPFEFYAQGHLTNPNMIVMGSVGFGKSATVKALVRRLKAVYGPDRYLAIVDPKGEYGPVADDLGLTVIKPYPGGRDRINPMEPGAGDLDGSVVARQNLAGQLVGGVLGRELSPIEDAVLGWAIERRCRETLSFTLRDLCSEVSDPPDELVRMSRHSPLELARATAPVAFALDKLCSRTLRGMFDGETTVDIDWEQGPGVVLDLSAVYGNTEALPLVIAAATHWLTGALRGRPDRRSVQVIDEAWTAVRHGRATSNRRSSSRGRMASRRCSCVTARRISPLSRMMELRLRRSLPGCSRTYRPACCCGNRRNRSPTRRRCSISPNANGCGSDNSSRAGRSGASALARPSSRRS